MRSRTRHTRIRYTACWFSHDSLVFCNFVDVFTADVSDIFSSLLACSHEPSIISSNDLDSVWFVPYNHTNENYLEYLLHCYSKYVEQKKLLVMRWKKDKKTKLVKIFSFIQQGVAQDSRCLFSNTSKKAQLLSNINSITGIFGSKMTILSM